MNLSVMLDYLFFELLENFQSLVFHDMMYTNILIAVNFNLWPVKCVRFLRYIGIQLCTDEEGCVCW